MKKLILIILFLPLLFKAQNPAQAKGQKDSSDAKTAQPAVPFMNPARMIIESYRQQVVTGKASMSDLARKYSEDPGSAQKGGLIINVRRGVMVPAFEEVAFSLKPGEVSEVFQTEFGYHFIQLLEHNGETLNLRHILVTAK